MAIESKNSSVNHFTPNSIPVILIGGFLGAGKTTLLNYILSENHGIRAAVLVNDFGSINIDAQLVVGVEGETINLANGCVCCNIRDDLISACLGITQQANPPEYVIIETSGVSDPTQVANTFLLPELQQYLTLNSILAVIDSDQFQKLDGEMAALAMSQIQAADVLVLNKLDLINESSKEQLQQQILKIAPMSRLVEASYGKIPLELLFENLHDKKNISKTTFSIAKPKHHHDFSTWNWTCDKALSLPSLRKAIEQLPGTVYRAKGIVFLEELPGYKFVMQMVGKRSKIYDLGKWGTEKPKTEIVLIGSDDTINKDELRQQFEACIGTCDESQSAILRLTKKLNYVK